MPADSAAIRLLAALALATAAVGVDAGGAAAECDGPISSFREVAGTAERVLIGDVVAVHRGGPWDPRVDGQSGWFTLRVRYVARGDAPGRLEVRDLTTQPCASAVIARRGDRIALALGATDFEPPVTVNTVAWIRGRPMDYPGVETITVAGVYRLLGLDPPDTATASPARSSQPPVAPLLVAGLAAGVAAWRRGARQRGPADVDGVGSRRWLPRVLSSSSARVRGARSPS